MNKGFKNDFDLHAQRYKMGCAYFEHITPGGGEQAAPAPSPPEGLGLSAESPGG